MPMTFDPSQFSLENYILMLNLLGKSGYTIANFATANPKAKHLIIRHDIDFDLQAALKMAEAEAKNGYEATYFVLLTSEFYNPLSKQNRGSIETILSFGHNVGLHFDTSLYEETSLSTAAGLECSSLEQLIGRRVDAISMHRPPSKLIGENVNFAGRLNTYSPYFTKEMGYCSDSRGAWHYGPPFDNNAYQNGKALQLLTHPIWWTNTNSLPPQQSVEEFLSRRLEFLGREAERNCQTYTHVTGT
jgi:hypothetical protein